MLTRSTPLRPHYVRRRPNKTLTSPSGKSSINNISV
ncbi:hypothetical protein SPAB_00243 [Salmonella enterica subsp. enterica serovar Paratyphi B str. SPB7]|uniref:Uncharacterized protein n=1 Tax=Salmonella paratyphi B (strain ATCC BAA-1250 / SPB7) TaxID=1016998 RepID=A0A6C6YY76_SALPB|nr:hypothetical protein SPAB_00243 [Salmonella enterica subsp. enterica serovar Paratyphi B str. SPB7]